MRIGIDFRGAQCNGGSMNRGIGRYVVNLILDLKNYAPEHELVLFVRDGFAIPKELSGIVTVPVGGSDWDDKQLKLWQKIPYIRSRKILRKMHINKAVKSQKNAMEKALRENPVDVIHNPSALDIGSYPIYDSPYPVVATFLDAIVFKSKEFWERCPDHLQEYYLEQVEHLRKTPAIVAISNSSASDAKEVFGIDVPYVVYPSVDPKYAVPTDRIISEDYYLFCSVPDFHKNPKVVIEAFSQLETSAKLIFICPEENLHIPELRAFANAKGVSDKFVVTGFIPEEQMASYFQHAIGLISPSQIEGFGLPVAQAMTAGTPVVTSNYSAQGEIAEGIGWLVDPNSATEVADAMKSLNRSRSEESRKRAEMFHPSNAVRNLVSIYKSLTNT